MGRGTIVGSIINSVLDVFGLGGRNETFTDIQISNLITYGLADDGARRTAKYNSFGSLQQYHLNYRGFQREYRRRYSKKFLENVGYSPSSTATTRVIMPSLVESYLEGLYGYVDVDIVNAIDLYMTLDKRCSYSVQTIVGYNFVTGKVELDGKEYGLTDCVETSPTSVSMTLTRDKILTITDNLTTNYSYDGTYVTIAGELYTVDIPGSTNGSGTYETTCVHVPEEVVDISVTAVVNGTTSAVVSFPEDLDGDGYVQLDEVVGDLDIDVALPLGTAVGDTLTVTIDGVPTDYIVDQAMIDNGFSTSVATYGTGFEPQLPNEVISTSVDSIVRNYSNALFDDEVTYVEYRVTSGEVDAAKRYFIAAADTLNIYNYTAVDVTTIIPMKEDNVIYDETTKLKAVLRRLGLGYEDLVNSLKNPDMDSAYLMTGLDPRVNNGAHNKLMFQMFDLITPGSGNITIAISKLSMNYSFTISKSTLAGVIGPVGTYTRSNQTATGIVLRYQGSSNQYQELVISSFNQRYTISGQTINTNLTADTCRLVIPLELFNRLRYKEWVDVYERSLCLLGYAVETVYVEWYERTIFGFFLKIVAIIILFWSWGTAKSISAFLWKAAASLVIAKLATMIAEVIGGPLGAIIATAVALYAMAQFGMFDGMTNTQIWLKSANTGLNTINQQIQHEIATINAEGKSQLSHIQELIDDVKDKNEEYEESNGYNFGFANFADIGKADPMFQSTEDYVNSIVNTESLVSGEWMYDIESQINTRNQVFVG